jgi:hypothetical protein
MEVNAQGLIFPDASVQISSYTDAKARLALSLTTTGTSGVATYNNTTGVFNIPNYGSALSGYVPYTGATADVDLDTHVLNAQALHVKGTAGNGHLGLKHQSASPASSANESLIFADVNGDMGWLNGNLYLHKFITSANTANRSYTFPNLTGIVAILEATQTFTATNTFTNATKNNGGILLQNASSSSLAGYMNIGGLTNGVKFTSGGGISNSFTLPSATGYTFTFPNATGTLALTSDLTDFVTLSTAQTISGIKTFSSSILSSGIGFFSTIGGTNYGGIVGTPTYFQISAGGGSSILLKSDNGTNAIIINTLGKVDFGSTIGNGTYTYTLPSATGTIALVGGSGVGTVTSVAALTIGTTGTDLSSTVATSTTTPVITLNVPTASATNRGALSSADWTTFNSKQGTITLTTTGTSGAATFSSNTLNIPNYAPDLSGYVTLSTTQTISGAKTFSTALVGTSAVFSSSVTAGGSGNVILGVDGTYANYNTIGFGGTLANGQNRIFAGNSSNGDGIYLQSKQGLTFWVNGTSTAAYIASNGNIIINNSTTDSGYKLDVNGTGRFSGQLDANILNISSGTNAIVTINSTYVGGGFVQMKASGTVYGYVGCSASILSGTTNDFVVVSRIGTLELGANSARGLIFSTSNVATFTSSVYATGFFESSDSRLKTLIQDNYQTKGIASITPKLYTKNGKVELGYYAQDFVGVLDSAVSKGSDDMLSLSYREVHTAKIYALEQRIKELETK